MLELTYDGMSLMYIKNRRGPSMVPWGTPDKTFSVTEDFPFNSNCCVLFGRNAFIHLSVVAKFEVVYFVKYLAEVQHDVVSLLFIIKISGKVIDGG